MSSKQSAERKAENAVAWLEKFAGAPSLKHAAEYAEQRQRFVGYIVALEHRAATAEAKVASLTAVIEHARRYPDEASADAV